MLLLLCCCAPAAVHLLLYWPPATACSWPMTRVIGLTDFRYRGTRRFTTQIVSAVKGLYYREYQSFCPVVWDTLAGGGWGGGGQFRRLNRNSGTLCTAVYPFTVCAFPHRYITISTQKLKIIQLKNLVLFLYFSKKKSSVFIKEVFMMNKGYQEKAVHINWTWFCLVGGGEGV